jgi:hypothetical protein
MQMEATGVHIGGQVWQEIKLWGTLGAVSGKSGQLG